MYEGVASCVHLKEKWQERNDKMLFFQQNNDLKTDKCMLNIRFNITTNTILNLKPCSITLMIRICKNTISSQMVSLTLKNR